MKIFPRVTVDEKEYIKYCIDTDVGIMPDVLDSVTGSYWDGMIWVRRLEPFTLLHEYIHHTTRSVLHYPNYGSLSFFSDFVDSIFDVTWGIVRYKGWRKHIWEGIAIIKEDWKFFLDFVLCRKVYD